MEKNRKYCFGASVYEDKLKRTGIMELSGAGIE
jgi:hypothetical protein